MHSFLIAAAFLAIVLSPCVAAMWNQSDPGFPRARAFKSAMASASDPMHRNTPTQSTEMLRCDRTKRTKLVYRHEVSTLTQAAIPSIGAQQ